MFQVWVRKLAIVYTHKNIARSFNSIIVETIYNNMCNYFLTLIIFESETNAHTRILKSSRVTVPFYTCSSCRGRTVKMCEAQTTNRIVYRGASMTHKRDIPPPTPKSVQKTRDRRIPIAV